MSTVGTGHPWPVLAVFPDVVRDICRGGQNVEMLSQNVEMCTRDEHFYKKKCALWVNVSVV